MKQFIFKVEQTRSSTFIVEAENEETAQKLVDAMDDDAVQAKAFGADGQEPPEYTNLDVMCVEER
jgi:hypothetical protein